MNPANHNIHPDSKLEYSWKDINLAQQTGFEECKRKVLKKLKECDEYYFSRNGSDDYRVGETVFKEIEKLK